MKHSEVARLLGFMKFLDKKQSTDDEAVLVWAEVLPEDLSLDLAMAAVKAFYRAPAETFEPAMTPRQLMRFVRQVKQDRRREEARRSAREATAMAPALEERRKNQRRIGGLGIHLKHPDDH